MEATACQRYCLPNQRKGKLHSGHPLDRSVARHTARS